MSTYVFLPDLLKEVEIPKRGILSRTLHNDDASKTVLFAFAEGEELSAHTAPMPALLYFVQGEASLRLGSDTMEVGAGGYAHMPPNLTHGIQARTPLVMLLIMVKAAKVAS